MRRMRDFQTMRVWRAAHRLTLTVYRTTDRFPPSERFGLAVQLRRSAASIGANLAEGCGRGSDADARRCFQIAFGSACEVLNHTLLARDLGLLDAAAFATIERESEPVRRMLNRLVGSLRPDRR
jgi:four helix bundle protein